MEQEKIVINLGPNKMAVLLVQPFDGDVDTESILKIDYSNLLGEILTFPVIFNRIANMKADMNNIVAERKLSMDIFEAQLYERHKTKLDAVASTSRGASIKDVEMAILRDVSFKAIKTEFFRLQRDLEYLDSLYWSAKSKDQKLNVLSEKITPAEFETELVEGAVNGVLIKVAKKAIRDRS